VTKLDWILSFVGIAGFLTFTGVIAAFVPEPDLLVVIAIAAAMVIYDFWIRPFRTGRRR